MQKRITIGKIHLITILLFSLTILKTNCQNYEDKTNFFSISSGSSVGTRGIPLNLYFGTQKNSRISYFGTIFKNIHDYEPDRFTTIGGGLRLFTKNERIFSNLKAKPFTDISLNFIISKSSLFNGPLKNELLYRYPIPRVSVGSYLGESNFKGLIKFNFSAFTLLEIGIVQTL